jgi:hypothetical protein
MLKYGSYHHWMVGIVKWQNNFRKILEWKCFLMVVSSIQWTTFIRQNNQKLIMGGILIKEILVIRNNILVQFT